MASALSLSSLFVVPVASTSTRKSALTTLVSRPTTSRTVRRSLVVVRASDSQKAVPPPQTPENFGLGQDGAWFGFGPRQELNVGRLAMMGFASALVMEVITGKGALGQLGLDPVTVRLPFLFGMTFLVVGGLLGGYVVINNPPDFSKAPANAGDGYVRNPFNKDELDRIPTYTRGGIVEMESGQKGREPYVSDLDKK